MKPFRLTRRALGSAVCMTLLAGTVLFTSPTPVHAAARVKTHWYSSITVIFAI